MARKRLGYDSSAFLKKYSEPDKETKAPKTKGFSYDNMLKEIEQEQIVPTPEPPKPTPNQYSPSNFSKTYTSQGRVGENVMSMGALDRDIEVPLQVKEQEQPLVQVKEQEQPLDPSIYKSQVGPQLDERHTQNLKSRKKVEDLQKKLDNMSFFERLRPQNYLTAEEMELQLEMEKGKVDEFNRPLTAIGTGLEDKASLGLSPMLIPPTEEQQKAVAQNPGFTKLGEGVGYVAPFGGASKAVGWVAKPLLKKIAGEGIKQTGKQAAKITGKEMAKQALRKGTKLGVQEGIAGGLVGGAEGVIKGETPEQIAKRSGTYSAFGAGGGFVLGSLGQLGSDIMQLRNLNRAKVLDDMVVHEQQMKQGYMNARNSGDINKFNDLIQQNENAIKVVRNNKEFGTSSARNKVIESLEDVTNQLRKERTYLLESFDNSLGTGTRPTPGDLYKQTMLGGRPDAKAIGPRTTTPITEQPLPSVQQLAGQKPFELPMPREPAVQPPVQEVAPQPTAKPELPMTERSVGNVGKRNDDLITNGFRTIDGTRLSPDDSYIKLKSEFDGVEPTYKAEAELPVPEEPKPIEPVKVAEPTKEGLSFKADDINYNTAKRAYDGISFDSDKRAKYEQDSYVKDMSEMKKKVDKIAKTDKQKQVAQEELARYKDKFIEHTNKILTAKAKVLSPMITGPANFPQGRNDKANARVSKLTDEFIQWQKKAEKNIEKTVKGEDVIKEETTSKWMKEVKDNIDNYQKYTSEGYDKSLFRANLQGKILRAHKRGDVEQVKEVIDYIKEKQPRMFAKNNKIFKLEDQLPEVKQTGQEVVKEYQGAKIINNNDAERVQIFFDEKPSPEIIKDLRARGFNFSRKNDNAWQRKNTNSAKFDSKNIVSKHFDETSVTPTTPEPTKLSTKYKDLPLTQAEKLTLEKFHGPGSKTIKPADKSLKQEPTKYSSPAEPEPTPQPEQAPQSEQATSQGEQGEIESYFSGSGSNRETFQSIDTTRRKTLSSISDRGKKADLSADERDRFSFGESEDGNIFDKGKELWHDIYRAFVDDVIDLKLMDKFVGGDTYIKGINSKKVSGTVDHVIHDSLVDLRGNYVGEGPLRIFKKLSNTEVPEFEVYLAHKHNIDRIKAGKPVWPDVTANDSKMKVAEKLAKYEHFESVEKDLRSFLDNFREIWLKESGLISEEANELFKKMYPNFINMDRQFTELEKLFGGGNPSSSFVDQSSPVKKITGEGSLRKVDVLKNLLSYVNKTIRTVRKNEVGQAVLEQVRKTPENAKMLAEELPKDWDGDKTHANIVSVWDKGEKVYLKINDIRFLKGLENISGDFSLGKGGQFIKKYVTQTFKDLITQKNPIFAVKNILKDVPLSYIQGSEWNPLTFTGDILKSAKDILTNADVYQQYKALGNGAGGFFAKEEYKDYVEKTLKKDNRKLYDPRIIIDAIETLNIVTEHMTRLPEFKRVLEKTGDHHKATYAAGEVTTNFARGGRTAKQIDAGAPYFNVSIQGGDRTARALRDRPVQTLLKAALVLSVPSFLVWYMNKDNPHYKRATNWTKDNYYLIPYPANDGRFIKIPKERSFGQFLSSLLERLVRRVEGEEESFKGYGTSAVSAVGPNNPLVSSMARPYFDLKSNKRFGDIPIVPRSLEGYSPELQYDERTSAIGKAIGGELGISPKEVDYIIDYSSGIIGDFLLPVFTESMSDSLPERALSPLVKAFTVDTAYSNQDIADFYETMDKVKTKAKDKNKIEDLPSRMVTKEERFASVYGKASKNMSLMKDKIIAEGDTDKKREYQNKIADFAKAINKAYKDKDFLEMLKINNRFKLKNKLR